MIPSYSSLMAIVVAIMPFLQACGSDSNGRERAAEEDAGTPPSEPPPIVDEHPPCVLNADCPAGQYCDLGECIQDCNIEEACADGLSCSPRGRCLVDGEQDLQPVPESESKGTVTVEPASTVLAPSDRILDVTLTSTSEVPVRYRIDITAPHLSIAEHRGEFTGSTTLRFDVDVTKARAAETPGTVRIITNLGEVVVSAPIQPGITGVYQGTMHYDVGDMALGDAAISVELVENGGQVALRVDPSASLLFPETVPPGGATPGATTGTGVFSTADGKIDATIYQSIPATFAGDRNYLARPVMRTVRLSLVPGSLGTIEGTFTEDIHGIFPQAARASGRISLQYVAERTVSDFTPITAMPTPPVVGAGNYEAPLDIFGWVGDGGVSCSQIATSGCVLHPDPAACQTDIYSAAPELAGILLEPLYRDAVLYDRSTLPFDTMAERCQAALAKTTVDEYLTDTVAQGCGLIVPLACTLETLANGGGDPVQTGKVYSDVVARLTAPVLLVGKNEITKGLEASFRQGLREEGERYDAALSVIHPMGRWLLQPTVVEHLRSLTDEAAQGTGGASSTTTTLETYPAARALSDLFLTIATLDSERGRIAATTSADTRDSTVSLTQQRALLAYLEAVMLGNIVESWQSVPPNVTSRFSGLLNPLNRGFSALVQGGSALGVPVGFVPFVYRPEDAVTAGPTNFEQMLAISQTAVTSEAAAEDAWLQAGRTFEQNNSVLQSELDSIRTRFDRRLQEICGPSFDPNTVSSDDWEVCSEGGLSGSGEVALRRVEVSRALEALQNHYKRAQSKLMMIRISQETAARVLGLRADQMHLIDQTGQAINAMSFAQGMIGVGENVLNMAANSNLFNAFAPAAMAPIIAVLGVIKVGIQAAKDQMQLAERLGLEQISAEIEYLNAMSNVKRELIEHAQIVAEMSETALQLVQAVIAERNALDEAHALMEERSRVMAVLDSNPANDPSYRLMRDNRALEVLRLRASAQTQLYLAGRALEFELNMSLKGVEGAVMNANNAYALEQLSRCFTSIHDQQRLVFGAPQEYSTTVSVRKLLGITGPRVDAVTGEELSEGRQFREYLLRNQNLDGNGGVGLQFSTTLDPDNGLWSTDVCSDRVQSVQAQLVGDFLGDNEAQVNLTLEGVSLIRECDSDAVQSWSLGGQEGSSAIAVLQAGVNTFGEGEPNTSLFGQSVARATWKILIPGSASAPANADVDITKIDDIVLRITHDALARRTSSWEPDLSCLGF